MSDTVIVAVLSLIGTLFGSVVGILTANKLTTYRIDKIEERLNMMDMLDKRINQLEKHNEVQDVRIEALAKETGRNSDDIRGFQNAD